VETQIKGEPRTFAMVDDDEPKTSPIVEKSLSAEDEDSYGYYDEEDEESKEVPEIILSSLRQRREAVSDQERQEEQSFKEFENAIVLKSGKHGLKRNGLN